MPSFRLERKWMAVTWLVAAVLLAALLDGRTRGLLLNSFWLATCTSAATIPAALVLATILIKFDVPGRRIAWIALVSALFLPLYLVATAWQSALGLQGWMAQLMPDTSQPGPVLSGFAGAVFIHSVALWPSVTLLIAAGLASVERVLEEDALVSGPPLAVLIRVTWRRSVGSIFAALVWIFIVCVGEMTVTDLFQIRTFAEEIYVQTAGGAVWDLAGPAASPPDAAGVSGRSFVLAVLLLGVMLLPAVAWCLGLIHRWQRAPAQSWWTVTPGGGRGAITAAVLLIVAIFIGLPLGSLFYHAGIFTEVTPDGYVADWSFLKGLAMIARAPAVHAEEILRTLVIGAAAATMATILAAALGVWATFRAAGKFAVGMVAAVLAAIPGPLVGLWTIHALNQPPDSPLSFLSVLYDEADFGFAPWLVQTLRVTPFAVLILVPAMLGTPRRLLESASLDGMGIGGKFRHVFLPLHWRSVAVAWLVALVLAIGELPATVLVAPPGVTPLSVRIFNLVHYGVDDQLAGLVLFVWLAVLVVTAAIFLLSARSARLRL